MNSIIPTSLFSRFSILAILALATFMSACTPSAKTPDTTEAELKNGDIVKVIEVIKGDEMIVEKDGQQARVRMLGIHAFAPVVKDNKDVETLSQVSEKSLQAWIGGQEVKIETGKQLRDPYNRYLAYISKDGADIGQRLIEQGHVVVYTEFPISRLAAYLESEKRARASQRSLWHSADSIKVIRGLRTQWNKARLGRDATVISDPLLETAETPKTPEASAQTPDTATTPAKTTSDTPK